MTDTTARPRLDRRAGARQSAEPPPPANCCTGESDEHRRPIPPGPRSVVVVREIQDSGLVMVENETPGVGVYPYLVKTETLVPAAQ